MRYAFLVPCPPKKVLPPAPGGTEIVRRTQTTKKLFQAVTGLAISIAVLAAQPPRRDLILDAGQAAKRVALVIGNAAYANAPLQNPVNDARAMEVTLRQLGFQSETVLNADLRSLSRAVDRFIARLQPGDVAFFYYAGHGVQIGGENLLVPVDFNAKDEADARFEAYPAARVQERMESSGARLNLVVLDACRNNPFRSIRSSGGGLSAMNTGRGTFIAFATAPGRTASDNPDGRNGLFTVHLVDALQQPGLSIDQVFNRTREKVFAASNREQLPWTGSSVIGEFYFLPQPAGTGRPSPVEESSPVVTAPVTKTESRAPDPAPPPPPPPELSALEEQFAKLAARAGAVRKSLETLQQAQGRKGLSLRGDISASWKLMENYMDQAEDKLKKKDAAGMVRAKALAETQVDKLEKFLGR